MLPAICFILDWSKILSSGNGLKERQESMDGCTGHCNITEILLKMALNTIQSINENIAVNGENDGNQHLLNFPHCFSAFQRQMPKLKSHFLSLF